MKLFRILSTTLFTALMVFGLTTKVSEVNTLKVRDVLTEDLSKEESGKVIRRVANENPQNLVSEAKAQVSAAVNGTRDIRFVVGLDSYMYESARFDITVKDGERVVRQYLDKQIKQVYKGVIANGKEMSASEVFGEGYNYLMAYTIRKIPASAWNYTFAISASVLPQESEKWASSVITEKQIAEMAALDEDPIITIDDNCPIYSGTTDLILDNDLSTYIWLDGIPSYVDFALPKETLITSLDIAFANQYGYRSLAAPATVSYKDANGDFVALGSINANNFNMKIDTDVTSFTTSLIRISGSTGAYPSIAEFSYNYEGEMKYDVILNDVGGVYHGSPIALFDGNSAGENSIMLLDAAPSVNGYIDIDLRKDTKLESLSLVTYNSISGMPRVQYRAEADTEFTTLTENAVGGYKADLRNRNISARYIRLTTAQDAAYDQWINYKEIVINGLEANTPTLHLEGSNTSIYSGDIIEVFDGDNNTFIWNNFATEAGDAYVFTYNVPFTLKNLFVYYRTGAAEICKYDSVAYKVEGDNEWHDIEFTFPEGTNALFLDLSSHGYIENVVQIKLYSSISLGGVWSGLATFETNLNMEFSAGLSQEYALTPTEGPVNATMASFISKAFDSNDATFYWVASGVGAQDYIVIDLGSVKHLNALNIDFRNSIEGFAANFTTIEYSHDGINWSSPIVCSSNTMNHEFSSTAHIRFIRFSGESGNWPSVASISLITAY